MKLIAHRGNITCKNPERENTIEYIKEALRYGVDVEIDVWYVDGEWILGHDEPKDKINFDFETKKNFTEIKTSKTITGQKLSNIRINCNLESNRIVDSEKNLVV